uniref:Uncharacterized protein n=1 Tax=Panagrellus redivivus TaxID=6233 RepID=A0A7E4VT65_PANRE
MCQSSIWWIKAFVDAKCSSLKEFTVYNAPLSIFKIDKKVLVKFMKAQRENFTLRFLMSDDIEWHSTTEQRLKNLFDERFERRVRSQLTLLRPVHTPIRISKSTKLKGSVFSIN